MAQSFVIVFNISVLLLLFPNAIEGGSIKYVPERDLMADPTLCRTTGNEWHFNLKDIARQSNETSVLSVFGQSSGISLFMTLDNFNSSKYYYLYIYNTAADIRSPGSYELLNETNYDQNPLNVSEFVEIEIQLQFGAELRIKVLLPNGAELVAAEKTQISIEKVYFGSLSKWYFKCPALKLFNKPSALSNQQNYIRSSTKVPVILQSEVIDIDDQRTRQDQTKLSKTVGGVLNPTVPVS